MGSHQYQSSLFIHVDDDSSNIVFQNQSYNKSNTIQTRDLNQNTTFDNYWIKPSPGDLHLFGWLIHGSNYQ